MLFLLCCALFAGLFVYAGLGLTLLLCPSRLRRHALFLAPAIGYCYCTLAGWYCHLADLKGTDCYGPALLVPPAALLCYALLRERRAAMRPSQLVIGESGAAVAIGCFCFLILAMPMVRNPDGLTSVSLGNNDVPHYASSARYVKEFRRSEPIDFLKGEKTDLLNTPTLRFGTALASALASSLFSLETYQLESVVGPVFYFFGVLLVFSLARELFGYRLLPALAVAGLCGSSPVLYYTTYQGFGSQIIAMTLGVALYLVLLQAMDHALVTREWAGPLALAALLNWGVVITYRHMLPFLYGPLVAYLLLDGCRSGARRTIAPRLLFLFASIGLGFLPSPARAMRFLEYLKILRTASLGWRMQVLTPASLFGLTFGRFHLESRFGHWGWLLWIAGIAVFAFSLLREFRRDPRVARLAASCVLVILTGYFALNFQERRAGEWGGYRGYKLVSFFLPQLLLGSLILWRRLEVPLLTARARTLAALLAALSAGSFVSACQSARGMARERLSAGRQLADLQRVERDNHVSSINICGFETWEMMWQVNFLLHKKLFVCSGSYYEPSRLDGDWDLKTVAPRGVDIVEARGFGDPAVIPVNASYFLRRAGTLLRARAGGGWRDARAGHLWLGAGDRGEILLEAAREISVDVESSYGSLNQANRLSASLNGNPLAACPSSGSCRIEGIVLPRGQSVLAFEAAVVAAGQAPPRANAYALSSIVISPAAVDKGDNAASK